MALGEMLEDFVMRLHGALLRWTTSHYTLAEASEAQLWPLAISINEFDDGNCVGISVQGSPDIDIRKECLIQRCSYARGNSVEAHLVYPDGLGLHKIRLIHIPSTLPNSVKVSFRNSGSCG